MMDLSINELSERLTSIRKAAKMSMAQVALVCNVSSGTVSNYEGGREPTLTFVKDFCKYFGISVDDFLDKDFNIDTFVILISTIVNKEGAFTGNNSKVSSHNNIVSNSRTKGINQTQGNLSTSTNNSSEKDMMIEFLQRENESLKNQVQSLEDQLKRSDKMIEMLNKMVER